MSRSIGIFVGVVVALASLAACPGIAQAQYNCAVAIELKGKAVLAGRIRDTERPSTEQLWDLLKTLAFWPTKDATDLPDPKTVDRATLKGNLRVKVDGAGQVELQEIKLVRNKLATDSWVIAPDDVARIIKLRNAKNDSPKK